VSIWVEQLREWFKRRGWTAFPFQHEAWEAYLAGQSGLIHAATGTGKTYAAWLGPLIEWKVENNAGVCANERPLIEPPLRVLWITPLRALAADTEAALRAPLRDLEIPWSVESRTGDTPTSVRARQRNRLPTALLTTPESLSLLLSRSDAESLFSDLRAVVVDEWHELMATKRGVQTELALARLRRWRPNLRTWGLSATIGNLETAMRTLLGAGIPAYRQNFIDNSHFRGRLIRGLEPKVVQIDSLLPEQVECFPWTGHLGKQLLPQLLRAVEEGKSTLIFTNTRSQTEIWYQAILEACPDWAGQIALHHGSLDREVREWVESELAGGRLRCVVCTSSLDLGVDFAPVDRVLQIGSPKGIARLLQRAGRSGHRPGAASRVTCIPTHAFELIEVAAGRDAVMAGSIEARPPVERPLDVLAQHLVTVALGGGFRPHELKQEVRTSHAYRELSEAEWEWVLDFVTRGGKALQAYPEFTRVVEKDGLYTVPERKVAQRHRLSIGTIVSDAVLQVQYLKGSRIGTVEESFIARLRPGDRFVFAGKVLEFVCVREMTAWVRKASSSKGAIPRWMGGRMPLSTELSTAVRAKLEEARTGVFRGPEMEAVRPVLELQAAWSKIPAADELLIERVKTVDGHHLFFYPFEGRLVHEGLAALFAYRISRLRPISFTMTSNDYGFELLAPGPVPLEEALEAGLLDPKSLLQDIPASLNAAEMAKRQFREIARVAGLIFQGYPWKGKSVKQLQASSGLLYDVFVRYDPENLLLYQANREVLECQLERSRLGRTLERLSSARVTVLNTKRLTPLAFPILADRLRESMLSSERLTDRVRRMRLSLENEAGREGKQKAAGSKH
jgi:ATP-dependent helicase Lhr and Lhr-like helicase